MPDVPPANDLIGAMLAIGKLKLSKRAKRHLQDIIAEATIRDRLNPARAEPGHSENIQSSVARQVQRTFEVLSRASNALLEMSDEEWQRLVDEANNGNGS